MEHMDNSRRREIYEQFDELRYSLHRILPGTMPDPLFLETAVAHRIPLLSTKKSTSAFMAEIIRWLNVKLAPCISVHGVLVDVYGEGVLNTRKKAESANQRLRLS